MQTAFILADVMSELTIRFNTLADIANFLDKVDVVVLDLDTGQHTLQIRGCPLAEQVAVNRFGAWVLAADDRQPDCSN